MVYGVCYVMLCVYFVTLLWIELCEHEHGLSGCSASFCCLCMQTPEASIKPVAAKAKLMADSRALKHRPKEKKLCEHRVVWARLCDCARVFCVLAGLCALYKLISANPAAAAAVEH